MVLPKLINRMRMQTYLNVLLHPTDVRRMCLKFIKMHLQISYWHILRIKLDNNQSAIHSNIKNAFKPSSNRVIYFSLMSNYGKDSPNLQCTHNIYTGLP